MTYYLIHQLSEGSLFPSQKSLEKYEPQEISEIAYLHILALYILLTENYSKVWAENYCRKTTCANNFRKWRTDATDTYILMHVLSNDREKLHDEKHDAEYYRDGLLISPTLVYHWIENGGRGKPKEDQTKSLFAKMDSIFRVRNASVRAVRRMVQDWTTLSKDEKRKAMTRLLGLLREHDGKSEVLSQLNRLAGAKSLESPADDSENSMKKSLLTSLVNKTSRIKNAMRRESASGGATCAASVATAVGGLGAGFCTDFSRSVYGPQKKSEKKKPKIISRLTESIVARKTFGYVSLLKVEEQNGPFTSYTYVVRYKKQDVLKTKNEFYAERAARGIAAREFPPNKIPSSFANDKPAGWENDVKWVTLTETLEQEYHEPLIRTVGQNFPDTFLHGTAKKNVRNLTAASRPDSSKKKSGQSLVDFIAPAEQNEFHAEMFLSDPRQPQQAHMFSQGKGQDMAIVRLKPGTKVLDLSDEASRAPMFGFGGHEILRFFSRPAITDKLIEWHLGRIVQGYKDRNPDWKEKYTSWMDPASPSFRVGTWQDSLVPYCKAHGIGAIRFADEILVCDRGAIRDARVAKPEEREAAASTRTWPGSKQASLFTDQKTDAHKEAEQKITETVAHPENYLYHTTSNHAAHDILSSGELKPRNYDSFVSLSTQPLPYGDIQGTDVTLVFHTAALAPQLFEVEYDESWFYEHPEQGRYIAGEGWQEQFFYEPEDDEDEFDDGEAEELARSNAELDAFIDKLGEDEWISKTMGAPLKFRKQDVVGLIINHRQALLGQDDWPQELASLGYSNVRVWQRKSK